MIAEQLNAFDKQALRLLADIYFNDQEMFKCIASIINEIDSTNYKDLICFLSNGNNYKEIENSCILEVFEAAKQ